MSEYKNVTIATDESSPVVAATASTVDGDFFGWAIGAIRRQFIVIAVFSAVTLLGGLLYLLVTPRTYIAQTEILFERAGRPAISQQPVVMDSTFDGSFFESQLKILRSDHIAKRAVEKLNLADDTEFIKSDGGFFSKIFGFFSKAGPPEADLPKADREERAVGIITERLDAKRIGITYIVEISFQSKDPERAAKIVEAVADAYIEDLIDSKQESAKRANEWLRVRLDDLRAKATADEQAVNAYKAQHQIVQAGGTLIDQQALAALNSELVSARAKKSETLARLDRIEVVLRSSDPNVSANATVSDALLSPVIVPLRQEYLSLASRAAEYSGRYGGKHLVVIRIREKMRNVQNSIISELRRLAETARSEYLIAKKRQEDIEKELATSVSQSQATDRAQVALRDLESAAQSSRTLYNLFQQRLVESTQEQALRFSDVRTIQAATVSNQKRAPKILGLSALAGLMLGGGVGILRELMDRVFRTSKQVEKVLGFPCVALVPALNGEAESVADRASLSNSEPRAITYRSPVLNAVLHERFSYIRESIRAIKLAVDLAAKHGAATAGNGRPGTVIGMVSALPGEGKSTMSMVFSQFASQIGQRVLLIDLDSRKSSLTRRLAPSADRGIFDLLSGRNSIADVLWTDPETNLDFLPISLMTQVSEPSELLAGAPTRKLLEDLRRRYSLIVIDLPPMMPLADVRATAHLIDSYFLIVEWGRTKIDVVTRTLEMTPNVSSKILGVVLNKTDMKDIGRYDSMNYSAYYDRQEV